MRKINLSMVLSNSESLTLFVELLAQEYCLECLLSLIEFIQFENYIFKHIEINFNFLQVYIDRYINKINDIKENTRWRPRILSTSVSLSTQSTSTVSASVSGTRDRLGSVRSGLNNNHVGKTCTTQKTVQGGQSETTGGTKQSTPTLTTSLATPMPESQSRQRLRSSKSKKPGLALTLYENSSSNYLNYPMASNIVNNSSFDMSTRSEFDHENDKVIFMSPTKTGNDHENIRRTSVISLPELKLSNHDQHHLSISHINSMSNSVSNLVVTNYNDLVGDMNNTAIATIGGFKHKNSPSQQSQLAQHDDIDTIVIDDASTMTMTPNKNNDPNDPNDITIDISVNSTTSNNDHDEIKQDVHVMIEEQLLQESEQEQIDIQVDPMSIFRDQLVTIQYGINFDKLRNFPKSSIVFNDDYSKLPIVYGRNQCGIKHLKEKCHLLYNKYIAVGSDYEINISSEMREYYISQMDNLLKFQQNQNISEIELLTIFEPCIHEMVYLLKAKLKRLKKKEKFKHFLQTRATK